MAYTEIIYHTEGKVALITLNRPETMNAMTITTHDIYSCYGSTGSP
jgi:enoyl-CoA hydratase/carnithine racemase